MCPPDRPSLWADRYSCTQWHCGQSLRWMEHSVLAQVKGNGCFEHAAAPQMLAAHT